MIKSLEFTPRQRKEVNINCHLIVYKDDIQDAFDKF